MRIFHRSFALALLLTLTTCALLPAQEATTAPAQTPADAPAAAAAGPEQYKGRAISTGTGRVQAGYITIWIDEFTADADARRYADLLTASGQDAVVTLWQKEKKPIGRFRFAQTLANDLRVARVWPLANGGRRLFLLSDRPIGGFEIRRGARSQDYPISIIELTLDAEGKGEGKLYPAVEAEVKDGHLSIKSWGHDPVDLSMIEPVEKKK